MITLVLSEVSRLVGRRVALAALLLALSVTAIGVVGGGIEMQPMSPAEVAEANRDYQRDLNDWRAEGSDSAEECVDDPDTYCAPSRDAYFWEPLTPREAVEAATETAAWLIGVVAFLLAASSIGAEFASGSIGTWLTFVPRRGAVFASKLIALVVPVTLISAICLGTLILGIATIAWLSGIDTIGMGAAVVASGRALAVPATLAALGYCLGMLTRSTAVTVGILAGYLVAVFGFHNALAAIVRGRFEYLVPPPGGFDDYEVDGVERSVGLVHGVSFTITLLASAIASSAAVFRRRDVH